MVERHTFLKDGAVWCYRVGWGDDEIPATDLSGKWVCYVHPETGCLCRNAPGPRRHPGSWKDWAMAARAYRCRWVNDTTAFLKSNGIWFECEMRPITQDQGFQEFDFAVHRRLSRKDAEEHYGKAMFCAAKRQLSRVELRQHGLANDAL